MSSATEARSVAAIYDARMERYAEFLQAELNRRLKSRMVHFIARVPIKLPRLVCRKRARHWSRQIRRSVANLEITIPA